MSLKSFSLSWSSTSRVAGSSDIRARTTVTARHAKGKHRAFGHRNVSRASPQFQGIWCKAEDSEKAVAPEADLDISFLDDVEKSDMTAPSSNAVPIFGQARADPVLSLFPVNITPRNTWGRQMRPAEKFLLEGKDVCEAVLATDIIPVDFFEQQKTFVVGTADVCDVRLPFKDIGERHAEVTFQDGKMYVTDLGTKAGTSVTNKTERVSRGELTPNEPTAIKPGSCVQFGSFFAQFEYRLPTTSEQFEIGRPPEFVDADPSRSVSKNVSKKGWIPKPAPTGPYVFHLIPEGKEVAKNALVPERFLFEANLSEDSSAATSVTVGRDETCDVVLPSNDYIGALHALFVFKSPDIFIVDLESVNGTRVFAKGGGQLGVSKRVDVPPGVPMRVMPGDIIEFAEGKYRLAMNGSFTLKTVRSDTKSKSPGVDEVVGNLEGKWRAPDFPVLLDGESITVGSDSACDVVIPLTYVSATHAKVEKRRGSLYITDLGSMNGTRIRDLSGSSVRECVSQEPLEMKSGDFVEFGNAGEYAIYQNINAPKDKYSVPQEK